MKIKFDSLDKKPKLYSLLIPVSAAAVAVAALVLTDPSKNAAAVCAVTAALCICIIAGLIRAFIRQLRYNPYSYNTVFYAGFALFTFFVFVTHVVLMFSLISDPGRYDAGAVLRLLLGSAKNYILITSPFLLAFSAALCVSNAVLIRREGKKPANLLGMILSFAIVAGAALIFVFDNAMSGSPVKSLMAQDIVTNLVASIYLYFECMITGTIIADAIAAVHEPEKDKDYIIILGCGLKKDGTPTPLLRGRIDRALDFARRQAELTGKFPRFITSGGKGADEPVSESASMKRYLLGQGVPEEYILEEDRSASTFENMKFSKEIIEKTSANAKIAFSTTNYHVFRSGLFARRVKMRAIGMGAKTKWYFWPNAAVREFAGLVTNHRVKQAVILSALIAAHVVMTLLSYTINME